VDTVQNCFHDILTHFQFQYPHLHRNIITCLVHGFLLSNPNLHCFLLSSHLVHNYYTTVRGPDILCNVIVSRDVTFYQINKFFLNILLEVFHY